MRNKRILMVGFIALSGALALAASGCSVLKKGKHTNTPVLGQRVSVLTGEGDVSVDPETTALPMSLPAPAENAEWNQSGGNATKSLINETTSAAIN